MHGDTCQCQPVCLDCPVSVHSWLVQVMDIKETRIDSFLKKISETLLCDLPAKTPWTLDEFQTRTKVLRRKDGTIPSALQ